MELFCNEEKQGRGEGGAYFAWLSGVFGSSSHPVIMALVLENRV